MHPLGNIAYAQRELTGLKAQGKWVDHPRPSLLLFPEHQQPLSSDPWRLEGTHLSPLRSLGAGGYPRLHLLCDPHSTPQGLGCPPVKARAFQILDGTQQSMAGSRCALNGLPTIPSFQNAGFMDELHIFWLRKDCARRVEKQIFSVGGNCKFQGPCQLRCLKDPSSVLTHIPARRC